MGFCWFAQKEAGPADNSVTDTVMDRVGEILSLVPAATEALLFTPGVTRDPYLNDGQPPALALQLYCPSIETLEAALAADGPLRELPALLGENYSQQAMLVRRFPTPDPVFRVPAGAHPRTYLVAYEGTAENLPVWLSHYLAHHATIMTRFSGVRRVEVYTRIDWCGGLPWRRVDHMQRNKVVFDDAAALTAALNSQVRHEMRADFAAFPPFSGPVSHCPMTTRILRSGTMTA